jgi:hypothetical protein
MRSPRWELAQRVYGVAKPSRSMLSSLGRALNDLARARRLGPPDVGHRIALGCRPPRRPAHGADPAPAPPIVPPQCWRPARVAADLPRGFTRRRRRRRRLRSHRRRGAVTEKHRAVRAPRRDSAESARQVGRGGRRPEARSVCPAATQRPEAAVAAGRRRRLPWPRPSPPRPTSSRQTAAEVTTNLVYARQTRGAGAAVPGEFQWTSSTPRRTFRGSDGCSGPPDSVKKLTFGPIVRPGIDLRGATRLLPKYHSWVADYSEMSHFLA